MVDRRTELKRRLVVESNETLEKGQGVMGKHMPGPWQLADAMRSRDGDGCDRLIESNEGQVCAVFGIEDSDCVANAQLIAASPQLLEACKDFVSKLDDYFAGRINIRPDFADRAREAIRLAEGRE